ncbi:MAG: sulfatase-like hydrolase/transferase [Pseudomonadales bacterium]
MLHEGSIVERTALRRIATRWVPAAGLVAALLWPLPHDARWDIRPDAALSAGKAVYLDALRAAPVSSTPNVLLIVADDLGRYDVGYHDPGITVTPAIDALAAAGTVFTQAYASAAICAPSRAALLTGRVQNRFGFESQPMQRYVQNRGEYLGFRYLIDTDAMQPFLADSYPDAAQKVLQGLPASEIALPEIFRRLGYATAILGKWHLGYGEQNQPRRFGFDTHYGFLEAFTLYASAGDPQIVEHHHDLFWERHIWRMGRSGPSAITRNGVPHTETRYLTDAILEETVRFIDDARAQNQPFFAYVPFSAPHTPFQARREDYDALPAIADHNRRVYLAMIRRLDHAVGRLVEHLKTTDLLENTLILFTSDNGGAAYTGATANGPLKAGKFTQFEGGLAVPLVLAGPGIAPGRVEQPVLLTDLFATLLARLGLPMPVDRPYDSVDLLATAGVPERHLYWRSDFNRALRAGRWKLIEDRRSNVVLLYDLDADPGERNNLAGAEPERVTSLLAELDRWEATLAEPLWPRVMNYRHQAEDGALWFAI